MKIIFDGDGEIEYLPTHEGGETVGHALNYVKVIIPIENSHLERHVKVTYEGVFEEIVAKDDGRVFDDACIEHEELLPS